MTYICLDLNQLHMEMMNSLAPVIVLASFPHLFVSALTQILLYNWNALFSLENGRLKISVQSLIYSITHSLNLS